MCKYKCATCDGSGTVHSHNPKCWDCNGSGETDRQSTELAIRSQIIPEISIIRWMAGVPFGKTEQDIEVDRLLKLQEIGQRSPS